MLQCNQQAAPLSCNLEECHRLTLNRFSSSQSHVSRQQADQSVTTLCQVSCGCCSSSSTSIPAMLFWDDQSLKWWLTVPMRSVLCRLFCVGCVRRDPSMPLARLARRKLMGADVQIGTA